MCKLIVAVMVLALLCPPTANAQWRRDEDPDEYNEPEDYGRGRRERGGLTRCYTQQVVLPAPIPGTLCQKLSLLVWVCYIRRCRY